MDGYVDHLSPVVLTAMNTGMRRGEILSMIWADINWEAKMLTIRTENAKSGRKRHIPLNTEAMEVVQRWAGQAGVHRAGNVFEVSDIKEGWGKLITDSASNNSGFMTYGIILHRAWCGPEWTSTLCGNCWAMQTSL